MYHGVVAGLCRSCILGLIQSSEIFLFIAVDQVASGETDPVVAAEFPLCRGRDCELLRVFDRFGAVEYFHGQSDGPDIDVGQPETQLVVVSIRVETLRGLFGFAQEASARSRFPALAVASPDLRCRLPHTDKTIGSLLPSSGSRRLRLLSRNRRADDQSTVPIISPARW